jgi:D-aminoacyl-tRNA deacylase
MRAVVQRVRRARVLVEGEPVASVEHGVCILLGVERSDADQDAARLAGRCARLRIFDDEDGRLDRSLGEVGGAALVVSQFTLIADSRRQRGNRPDFSGAAPRERAEPLYECFCEELRALAVPVEAGVFGARMQLELVNDGPVTIVLDVEPTGLLPA